jgi:SH3-like domain-containing protein
MRHNVLIWFTLVISGGSICCGQEQFPYTLVLNQGQVEVRSGPGSSFYVTDHLAEGIAIEVYRHHEDGWLGIRPPVGSFSWVPADHLTSTHRAGIARVVRDDTICRVGSRVAEVEHHVGQVYLENEESVQLLDELSVDTQTARQLEREGWRRIAPPAGEFRWVRASDAKRASRPSAKPRLAAAPKPADAVPTATEVRPAAHWHQSLPGPAGLTTAQVIQAVAIDSSDEAQDDSPQDEHEDSEESTPDASATDDGADASESEAGWASRSSASGSSAFQEKPSESESAGDSASNWASQRGVSMNDLLDVEMRLAMTASREIHLWRLQPLRDRIEALQPRLKTDAQRDHAKSLLDRITEYETLQNRFAVAGENAPMDVPYVSGERTGAVGPSGWEDSLLSRFDGNGWLVPVHSTRRIAPPYALLDAEGEVLFYVAPSPGLNLHRYLRKRVGVYGQRIAHQSLNKPLITAERVIDLGRHLH